MKSKVMIKCDNNFKLERGSDQENGLRIDEDQCEDEVIKCKGALMR